MALGSVFALLSLLAPPPVRLVVDSILLVRLQTIAAGLENEMVLCLTGTVKGAEAVVTGFTIPAQQVSTSDHATVAPCPRDAVAIWHNHPLEAPPGSDPNLTPRDLCALSETDIRTTSQGSHYFVVVAVDANTWCWWSRDQVRNLARLNSLRGDPVPGQISSLQPTISGTSTRIY